MASNLSESESVRQSDPASSGWDKHQFTTSSNYLLNGISKETGGVNLLEVLTRMIKIHPEYGNGVPPQDNTSPPAVSKPFKDLISFLQEKHTILQLPNLTSNQWAKEIHSIIALPNNTGVVNGRLFLISSLLRFYEEINVQLNADPKWKQICTEMISKMAYELKSDSKKPIDYQSLLSDKGQNLLTVFTNQSDNTLEESIISTNNLSDGPAIEDSLSRKALATYLAKRINHLYTREIVGNKAGSFFMHIDGAWGSGKSTLLRFLETQLTTSSIPDQKRNTSPGSEGKWVVVNFNAWENQRLDPPWWFLMKTVYREAMNSLSASREGGKKMKLFLSEHIWRLTAGRNYLLAVLLTFILFIISLLLGINDEVGFTKLPVIELITFIGFLWSLAKLFGSSLASGSAKAAKTFIEENSKDPMQVLAKHFNKQIERIGYPVAIFIDDLDRCNKDYGVKLLEGLQTIFKKAPVVYVIAADRKWLSKMYETQYEMFASVIERPAKPFGLIFLDKIFQLIVELPDISAVQKRIYWKNLLNVKKYGQPTISGADREAIKQEVKAAHTNANKMDVAVRKLASPELQQVAREEALSAVSIKEEQKLIEHKLEKFVDLIEPNPRAMKRLINDISTARAIAYLYDQEVEEDQLILWTVLKLQHPLLAEYFWHHPHKINDAFGYTDSKIPFTNNTAFDQLLVNEDVKKLFQYVIQEKTILLDTGFLSRLKFQEPPIGPKAN